jgi:tRNA(Arg) A34 adenosine deaminase TadA
LARSSRTETASWVKVSNPYADSWTRARTGLTLYSTVEPCVLCAYVVRSTGIGQVVFGIAAGRLGGCTSSYALLTDSAWPGSPPPSITRGILAAECADLMREYEGRRDRDGNGAGF